MPEITERPEHIAPDRNLAVELVRVTEAAALAAARWIGRGEKNAADQAAVDAMRLMLRTVEMDGVVVIGEGEKDEAPMLYNGESVGAGRGPRVDVAVDPLEGTVLTAPRTAERTVGDRGRRARHDALPGDLLHGKARRRGGRRGGDRHHAHRTRQRRTGRRGDGKSPRDVVVVVLERERNAALIEELRALGARLHLIPHGDTAPAIAAARSESGVDLVMGIGGGTEGVLAAAALKCLGGAMQARLWPRDDVERARLRELGKDPATVLTTDDLVAGQDVFVAATGVTTGSLLAGVLYNREGAITESVVMRSRSGTVRTISAEHRFEKLERFTGLEYRWRTSAAT